MTAGAALDDDAPAPLRRRNAHPERGLSTMIHKWSRAHIAQPHFWCAHDRSQKTGEFTHVREKAMGIVSGFPDTSLIVPNFRLICAELKAPGKKPTTRQYEVGEALKKAGAYWAWFDSVEGYASYVHSLGVPLLGNWLLAAQGHDATLRSAAIRHEEGKTGRVSPKRRASGGPRYLWKVRV